jgi:membrane-bound inhibitor of C-type lysozyme
MRTFICTWAVIATTSLLYPWIATATEPAGEALPAEIIPTNEAPGTDGDVPAGEGAAPAPADGIAPPSGGRFKPAPSRGIQPTVSRLPAYWQCQDDLESRLVVTFLDTAKPQAVLERGGKKVITTLQRGASGAKYMAPGGILFWDRGHEATLQWGSPNAASCTPLGG